LTVICAQLVIKDGGVKVLMGISGTLASRSVRAQTAGKGSPESKTTQREDRSLQRRRHVSQGRHFRAEVGL